MARSAKSPSAQSTATIGFEAKLWLTADKLRNNMDAAEYKHVVLGLIFLKYISDTFEEHRAKLVAGKGDYKGSDPEESRRIQSRKRLLGSRRRPLGSPPGQRQAARQRQDRRRRDSRARARQPAPQGCATEGLRPPQSRQAAPRRADRSHRHDPAHRRERRGKTHRSVDLLGRVYEYFLTRFASAEGKNGGQFYTPSCVVRCLVEMLAPYKGRIYDPACGSGGMFVQSEKFVESYGGKLGDISIYGQESNATTRRLAVMNLVNATLYVENFKGSPQCPELIGITFTMNQQCFHRWKSATPSPVS